MRKKVNFVVLDSIVERNIPVSVCNCNAEECRGFYIQTRENQTMCLYGMRKAGVLDQFFRQNKREVVEASLLHEHDKPEK